MKIDAIFKETMVKNVPNQIQGAMQILRRINTKKTTPG